MWLIPAALLLVAVLLVFGQCAAFGWTNWDDHLHVTENPKLNPLTLAHLVEFWREPYGGLYIPVSYTLFGIEAWLGRSLFWVGNASAPPAAVFHVTSIALHGACVLLVWRLLTTLVGRPWPAAAGAMLFAVHPLQVESVAWISEQRGLLSALFSLVALLCHLQARRSGEAFWHRGSWQAFAAFVAAILSKPSAMTLPLAAGVIDLLLLRRPWRRVAAELAPWCAVSAIAAIGTKLLQPDTIVLDLPPLGLRPIIAGDAIGFYVSKLLMPLQLGIDYGRTPESLLHDSLPWVGALSIAAAIALLFLLPALRSCRLPAVLFLAPLLPVLGFVPFAFQHISTVADRYTYLAMLGPALGISLVLACAVGPHCQSGDCGRSGVAGVSEFSAGSSVAELRNTLCTGDEDQSGEPSCLQQCRYCVAGCPRAKAGSGTPHGCSHTQTQLRQGALQPRNGFASAWGIVHCRRAL